MKILTIFVDMLRTDRLNYYNKDTDITGIDRIMQALGGTIYSNCFTSGADTARSLAEYWSGVPCYLNGCNRRARYPQYFLCRPDFLKILHDNGYSINLFANAKKKNVGIFPASIMDEANINNDFDIIKFLSEVQDNTGKEYTFIDIDDFHWAIDDLGPGERGARHAEEETSLTINKILTAVNIDKYDEIVIFSDHGFLMYSELQRGLEREILSEKRSKIVSFIHRRGDTQVNVNDKLCSMSDFFSHYLSACNIEYNQYDVKGIAFESEAEHDFLCAEDFFTMQSALHMNIDIWAVRTRNSLILYQFGLPEIKIGTSMINATEILLKNCPEFCTTKKVYEIMNYYSDLKDSQTGDKYTNGNNRIMFKGGRYLKSVKQRLYNRYFRIW